MGPKGIGPQKLGAGQSTHTMPDGSVMEGASHSPAKKCGCGKSPCDCGKSPNKIVGVLASALVGKAVDKMVK
jgi:hypothetical protein